MAFPPEFSSTLVYERRYDLDKIDVFMESDALDPMFFSITGLPTQLSYGKHYFNISLLDTTNNNYRLRNNSKILFEFKSVNDVIIKSDVVDYNQRNGITTCHVEVLEDPLRTRKSISDGVGTLVVVGSLTENYKDVPKIPNKFINAMNHRCTFPITVRKNLINASSPVILQSKHELKTTFGQFSFAKASISPQRGASGGNTYAPNGQVSTAGTHEGQTS